MALRRDAKWDSFRCPNKFPYLCERSKYSSLFNRILIVREVSMLLLEEIQVIRTNVSTVHSIVCERSEYRLL